MLSKFCSKWYFYPISSKIACVYFARSGKFTPFRAKLRVLMQVFTMIDAGTYDD